MRQAWRLLRRYGPLLLIVGALAELALHQAFARRWPRFDEYARLGSVAVPRAGEALVVTPSWAEPMVRRALGDRLGVEAVSYPELGERTGAVEISVLGHRAPELAGWPERSVQRLGPFTVRRLDHPAPEPVAFDFVAALGPGVHVYRTAAPHRPCRWREDAPVSAGGLGGHPTFVRSRFMCGGSALFNVGATIIADQAFRPRRCLWAHPPERGALVIRYPEVELGERIVGHGGMYWLVERERLGPPVELVVRINDDEVGRYIHADRDGWSRFDFALGAHARTRAAVSFEVRSPDHRHRHFCFEARSR